MKLRGTEFGDIWWASGTFGFFGEKRNIFGTLFCSQGTFISQTVTAVRIESTSGTKSISEIGGGVICTSSDVSNSGLEKLLKSGKLQQRKNPFFVSIAFSGTDAPARLLEAQQLCDVLQNTPKNFRSPFGIVISFSEPDDNDYDALIIEMKEICEILSVLGVPLVVEISMFFPPDVAQQISAISQCDALMLQPAVRWSQMSVEARTVFFRTKAFPIKHMKDGDVYGKYLLPLAIEWIRQANKYAGRMPILASGGILNTHGVEECVRVGASGIVLDRANFLRFWNIRSIVSRIQKYRTKQS